MSAGGGWVGGCMRGYEVMAAALKANMRTRTCQRTTPKRAAAAAPRLSARAGLQLQLDGHSTRRWQLQAGRLQRLALLALPGCYLHGVFRVKNNKCRVRFRVRVHPKQSRTRVVEGGQEGDVAVSDVDGVLHEQVGKAVGKAPARCQASPLSCRYA